jgi:hypothetical protein
MRRDILAAARAIAAEKDVQALAAIVIGASLVESRGNQSASYLHMFEKCSESSNANNNHILLPGHLLSSDLRIYSRKDQLGPPT